MEKEEIFRYITVGSGSSISIDRRELSQYPGIIRELIIRKNTELQINFLDQNNLALDEGEITFYFHYETYERLFQAAEEYLEMKLENWTNYSRTGWYPDTEEIQTNNSWNHLVADFAARTLKFPKEYIECRIASLYWNALYWGEVKPEDSYEIFAQWIKKQERNHFREKRKIIL